MLTSILDNDLYKFTMQNAVMKRYPRAEARYRFIDRNHAVYPDGFAKALKERIYALQDLALTAEEWHFLRERCYYLDPAYLDFLKGYRYDPADVVLDQQDGRFSLTIQGPWYRTILWEVPLLAMVSELFFEQSPEQPDSLEKIEAKACWKAEELKKIAAPFSDFGTRRRYSGAVHELVVASLKKAGGEFFLGTSNVHLAKLHNLTPIGTMAHEWIMFHAAANGYQCANRTALAAWVEVYQGEVGIALSDTFTTEVFFRDFSVLPAKLFDGVRQDSGDPLVFAEAALRHYNSLRINPAAKTIVFSDNLNIEKVKKIRAFCKDKVHDVYGIGTYFTNDAGVVPLNIVIKLAACRTDSRHGWTDAVKLSDDPGKHTGEKNAIRLCLETFNL